MTRIYQSNTIGNVVESADEYTKRLSFSTLRLQHRKKHLPFKIYSRNTVFRTLIDYIPEKEKAIPCYRTYKTLKNLRYRPRKSTLRRQYANT